MKKKNSRLIPEGLVCFIFSFSLPISLIFGVFFVFVFVLAEILFPGYLVRILYLLF